MAFGFDEMNHCQVSLPWGGRSSRETSPEPHSRRSKPQANLPIMVVGLPGEALPLALDRQESICAASFASRARLSFDLRLGARVFGGLKDGIHLLTQAEKELTQ